MKKLIFVALILFCSTINYSQNIWNYSKILNENKDISSVNFINADLGYVLIYEMNNSVTLYKTTNRGLNWNLKGNFANITSIYCWPSIKFINENTGFIVTKTQENTNYDYLTVYKTIDGGNNWNSILTNQIEINHTGVPSAGYGVKTHLVFVGNNIAYLNAGYEVYKTTDCCQTWNRIIEWSGAVCDEFKISAVCISKANSNIVYAGGGSGLGGYSSHPKIRKSTDGGNNWTEYVSYSEEVGGVWYMSLLNENNNDVIKFGANVNMLNELDLIKFTELNGFEHMSNFYYAGHQLDFIDNNTCIIDVDYEGDFSRIINSTDGGYTWNLDGEYTCALTESLEHQPFSACGDIRYAQGYGNNSTFILTRKIDVNIFAKSDYTDNNTQNAEAGISQPPGPGLLYSLPHFAQIGYPEIIGGTSLIMSNQNSSNDNDLFYKWSYTLNTDNPMNPYSHFYRENADPIIANYKTKQKSTTQNAISNPLISYNSPQTKALKDSYGYFNQIHESMGGIFYTRSTTSNGGNNWIKEEVVNGGSEYYLGFPSENTTDNNSCPSICELRYLISPDNPFQSNINSAATWQRYNNITGEINLKVAFRVFASNNYFWRKYGTNYTNYSLNDGIIRHFTVQSTDYKSKPSIISSFFESGNPENPSPLDYFILIPHLEPSTNSGNMLCVTAKFENQTIEDHITGQITTNNNFIIDGSGVTDYSVTAKPYSDEDDCGYIVYFAYLKDGNILYRADKFIIDQNYNIHRYFYDGDWSNQHSAIVISSDDQNQQARYSPDISLMNGKPIIAYQGYKLIQQNSNQGGVGTFTVISAYDHPIIVRYRNNNGTWNTPTFYSSGGHIQHNPNIEGNINSDAYILNYSYDDDNHYRQLAYVQANLRASTPWQFTGTDEKIVRGSFSGSSYPNSFMMLTLSPSGSLYNIGSQSITISNSLPSNTNDNLVGTINEQNADYSFNIGAIVVKGNNIPILPDNDTSITGLSNFNDNMVSAPFRLGPNDTLLLRGSGYYTLNSGGSFTQKKYTVDLIRYSDDETVCTLLEDSIKQTDTIETVCFRGFIMNNLDNTDSFYVNLYVDSSGLSGTGQVYSAYSVYSFDSLSSISYRLLDTIPSLITGQMTINSNTIVGHDIEIADSGKLNIQGNISFKMAPGKKIYVSEGGKLVVNGVTFNCTDSTQQWAGIYFENSTDSCSIQNSTFNNATLPIKIVNDDDSYIENGKVIANNVFNTQNNNIDYVIYAENSYNMKIENNQFNMMTEGSATTGIYTKNHDNGTQNNGDGDGGGTSGGKKNSDVSKYAFLGTNPVLPEQVFGRAENQKGNSITEDPTPPPIFIKILYNTFNDGNVAMILTSYISERTPYYICGNTFTGDYVHNNIIGRMMTGRVRNNSSYCMMNPIYLEQSNVDMFQNVIIGSGTSIVLNGHSFINLAPIDNGTASLIWSGGQNNLFSGDAHNIVIADAGFAYINYGLNTFERSPDMNYFHIFGILDSTVDVYYARNNEWHPGGPHNFLYSSSNPYIITDSYGSYGVMPEYNGYTIVNKGQDVYDTIFTSPNNINDTVPQDEILFNLAIGDRNSDKFFKAICDFKFLIDNYPSSIYVAGGYSLYNLYDTYQLLDTGDHNVLFSDLENFLLAKIQSSNYDEDFIDVAYYLEIMCASSLCHYYDALTGFQFVAMYHPDAEMRLLASWDAAEVEELMNQSGGVSNAQLEEQGQEQLQEQEKVQKEFRNKLLTKLDIAVAKDSVMKIMKKIYDAKNKEIEGNSDSFESSSKDAQKSIKNESNIKSLKTSNNNQKIVKSQNENNSTLRQNDRLKKSFIDINQRKELISRAERNLRTSRSLSAEERQKRQKEDMLYIAGLHSKINKVDNSTGNIPSTYKLYQNYPNPFNPVTKIKYDLPMDSKVTLVVYDVLGRQMTKLVSDEFKKSGTYTVEFNGQAFASGVYFYQIQMGNYVQTKKMVLIK